MGLDNIPRVYACRMEGTAITNPLTIGDETTEQVNCTATIEAGGCPWHRDLGELAGGVTGIFGTHCWYRGKSGMAMIALLPDENQHAPHQGFYGPDSNGLDPDQCRELADWMADRAEMWSRVANTDIADNGYGDGQPEKNEELHRDAVLRWRYAVAWLRWVAEHCNGTDAWW